MTVLEACQSALMRLVKKRPNTVFSSQDPTVMEVADLVSEVGAFIMKKHEWQALTSIHSITADGTTTVYDLPSDYDRMLTANGIIDPNSWFWGYDHVGNVSEWLRLKGSGFGLISPGAWIILGNQFNFLPAPAANQKAEFPYISKNFARSGTGTPKASFTQDADTFVLNERLLTLGIIWMWRVQKRLDSSAEEDRFFEALSEEAARDAGAWAIRSRRRVEGNFHPAWPWELG